MQLARATDRFRTHLEANRNSPHTISSYLRDLGLLTDAVGADAEVADLAAADVAAFLTSDAVTLKHDGSAKAPGSADKVKTSLKAFFRWAHDAGLVEANPTAAIRLRHRRRPAPDVLTPQEKRRFVKAIDRTRGDKAERDAALIDLILNTGLRVSEVLGLDLADLNVPERPLTVTAKGGESHKVFLNARTRKRLAAYLKKRRRVLAESQEKHRAHRPTGHLQGGPAAEHSA